MKKIRILLAALLILAMMAPMAMADEDEIPTDSVTQSQTIIGKGSYADPSSANVWSIKLPTAELVSFTIDPKRLVSQTDAAEETDDFKFDSSATVLFTNYNEDGNAVNVSSEIEALTVENQGTTDVIVSLNIRPTDTNMVINQSSGSIDDDTKPEVVFKAKKSSDATYKVVSAVGLNFSSEVKANSSAWKVEGDTTEGFRYIENGDVTGDDDFKWNSVTYKISGMANSSEKADWSGDLTPPNLQLTWFVMNENVKALPVNVSSEIMSGTKYVMAADRLYAQPSETVTVYVQPSYPDNASPAGYVVDVAPSDIQTATMNYYQNKEISTVANNVITFSNGVASDNHTVKYVFNVPGEDGFKGFSMMASSASGYVDNQILINGAPIIKKLVITANSSAV